MPSFLDRTGERYGRWIVLERAENKGKRVCWKCLCDCGDIKIVIGSTLGRSSFSCGCFRDEVLERQVRTLERVADLTGKVFGRWSVLGFSHRCKTNQIYWACICDCGKIKNVSGNSLKTGQSKSCGCLASERSSERSTTHGMSKHELFGIWTSMKQRCNNPNNKRYKYYGGRGIKVCERWLENPKNFFVDMGRRPSKNHSIERIDVNGDYCPENCKWVTRHEQSINKRNTRKNICISKNAIGEYVADIYKNRECVLHEIFNNLFGARMAVDDKFEEMYDNRPNNTKRKK